MSKEDKRVIKEGETALVDEEKKVIEQQIVQLKALVYDKSVLIERERQNIIATEQQIAQLLSRLSELA